MDENWKELDGFNGVYQVSDHGRIKRAVRSKNQAKQGQILKCNPDRYGYRVVILRKPDQKTKLVRVHIAVLETFVSGRPVGCDGSHINGNRLDCRLSNLCWETPSANHSRKFEHGTLIYGEKHKCSKLKSDFIPEIRSRINSGETAKTIANDYGVSRTVISNIKRGMAWVHI